MAFRICKSIVCEGDNPHLFISKTKLIALQRKVDNIYENDVIKEEKREEQEYSFSQDT